jgi:rRNA-processing protein FCF1
MDCLYAKCTIYITDCVMGELEKLGQKYRVALRIARDPRFERLPCTHKVGNFAGVLIHFFGLKLTISWTGDLR